MPRRSAPLDRTATHRAADAKWRECDHVLAIRARRYQADEVPTRS